MMTATEICDACHGIIDNASAFLANIDCLQDGSMGSALERGAMAADARTSVHKLVAMVRTMQDAARES